jgi:hypothetical protein
VESYLVYKLQAYERSFFLGQDQADQLLAQDGTFIRSDGQVLTKEDLVTELASIAQAPETMTYTSISQKTKLLTYQLADQTHTSLWRRHEEWRLIFHQISQ